MQEPEFNLQMENWILATTLSGETVALSILEVFARAHELTALAGDLPTQDVVVMRLLLAILHAAYPYTDENGEPIPLGEELDFWEQLWRRGSFQMDAITRYLEQYRDRFWLFHPERPFYQVATLDKGTSYGASKLIGELSESSNKLRLFQSRNGSAKSALSYSAAARWLLYLTAFDDTSSKPSRGGDKKLPSPGAGWLGKLGLLYAVGPNLFKTLLLNFILTDDNGERWEEAGGAAWEPEKPRTGERVEIPMPRSQAALLTLQSRRILLERERGAVTGFRLLGGDFFLKENAFSEQMTVWRTLKDQPDVYTPKRHDVEKLLWRDFSSLFKGAGGARLPGIVRWVGELRHELPGLIEQAQFRATAVLYGDKDFFVTDIFDDVISVNAALLSELGEVWNLMISQEIESTEKAVNQLGYFASELAEAAGDSHSGAGRRRAAREEAYFRLDASFRDWLSKLDPAKDKLDEQRVVWRKTARRVILRIGGELVSEAGEAALVGRVVKGRNHEELLTAPKSYNKFIFFVRKALEYDEEGLSIATG